MNARAESRIDALWERGRGTVDDIRPLREEAARAILAPVQAYSEQWDGIRLAARSPLTAIEGPRRCGKTEGVGRWLLALMIALDSFVVRMLTEVLSAPTDNWLEREGGASALNLIAETGLSEHCHVLRQAGSVKRIRFAWGSALHVHDIANVRAITHKRGFRAHVYWPDEAQDIALLPVVLSKLVLPTLLDFGGRVVATGTPGTMIGTLFHRAVQGLDGWGRHRLAPWNNPAFGATVEERWARICETVIALGRGNWQYTDEQYALMRALTPEQLAHVHEPELPDDLAFIAKLHEDLQREIFGRWVRATNAYVFPWHRVDPATRYWARDADTLQERFARLPTMERFGRRLAHGWKALIGMDLGFLPDPCALVVLLWAPTCERAFVLFSCARYELGDDEALTWLVDIAKQVLALGVELQLAVADLTGTRKGTHASWNMQLRQRMPRELPIHLPRKEHKNQQIRAMGLDIVAGRYSFIEGDALDIEGSNLQWRQDDGYEQREPEIDKHRKIVLEDGSVVAPGDHCLDALRYLVPWCPVLHCHEPEKETEAQDEAARLSQMLRQRMLHGG